ncbi:MAG: aldo/keto reductase [Oligoflexia bacterium]|nr:aldo/keto reductase [Oligoflexia bacterium]
MNDFTHRTLPVVDKEVMRLGLATNYGLDADGIRDAVDRGMNYLFWTPRKSYTTPAIKDVLARDRDAIVLATGPTTGWWGGNIRRFTEHTLRLLGTDYLDILQVFWVGVSSALTDSTMTELLRLRDEGKTRAIGISIHDRQRAGRLAADSDLDLLMIRYNAAHPGAEKDIFPHLVPGRRTVTAYTSTSWRKLLKAPRRWKGEVATAGQCYRFGLSNPFVDVVLTGPKTREQLDENLAALQQGPMEGEEMDWMRKFGTAVHG